HFGVSDLRLRIKKANTPVYEIGLPRRKHFLYPLNTLEPNQFQRTRSITHFSYQPAPPSFAHRVEADEFCRNLYVLCLRRYIPDEIDLGFIDMPVRKMLQQIFPCKNGQFFFEQVATLRANALEVFDGVG